MNEDGDAMLGKDQIGRAGEVASVKSEAVSELMDDASDGDFGTGIRCLDARHDRAAFGR